MTGSNFSPLPGDLVGPAGGLGTLALVACVSKRKAQNAVRLTAHARKPGSRDIATFRRSLSVRSRRVPRGVNHPTIHVSNPPYSFTVQTDVLYEVNQPSSASYLLAPLVP